MSNQDELESGSYNPSTSFRITEPMLLSLRQTKPWVRLLSIVGFLSIGFVVIAGIAKIILISKFSTVKGLFPLYMCAVSYILIGMLYFFPSLFLFKFASSIGRLIDGGGATEMEEALSNQKAFWIYIGILTPILFSFALICIVTLIIIPQFAKMAG